MANNRGESETYHEVPASKYWYLGDAIGAVPKGFFKFWTPFLIISTASVTAIACLTDWWPRFFMFLTKYLYVTHWYIGWPSSLLALGVGYWYYKKKQEKNSDKK